PRPPARPRRSTRSRHGTRKLDRHPPVLMNLIAQTLADGLVLGGIYALAAVGFSLIFGVLHVINLSHGILVLMGAYLALILSTALHIDPLLCIPPVMAVLFCVGYAYPRFLIQ